MGLFTNSEKEESEIRGATAAELKGMTNEQVIMIALYRQLVGSGFDDALCDELRERGNRKPNAGSHRQEEAGK